MTISVTSRYRSRNVARTASTTCGSCGKAICSSGLEYGIGTSAPVTRWIGASRSSKACSWMSAARFAPTPPCGQPSSTMTQRFVLRTEARIVSRSSGRSVRGSMTSASMLVLLAERLRRARGGQRHPRDPDDRHVVALAADRGLAEADGVVLVVGNLAALAVEVLVLDEDDRVVVADRGLQQALGVGGGRRHRDEQAGHVEVQRLPGVRVRRAELMAGALRHAHDERHLDLAAEHVADRCGVVDDLVHRQQREVDRHELHDRAQAGHRRADAHADDRVLGDRRVAHALLAELLEQAGGDLERAVEDADVLAHEHDVRVALPSPRAAPRSAPRGSA